MRNTTIRLFLLLTFLCLIPTTALAASRGEIISISPGINQKLIINGRVLDITTNKPIYNAGVTLKVRDIILGRETTYNTTTDKKGVYSFNISSKLFLSITCQMIVSSNGYQKAVFSFRPIIGKIYVINFYLLDIEFPIGGIKINNNAEYTNTKNVTLSLTAYDGGSGISKMRLSSDGRQWTPPESFILTKQWKLQPGDGKKAVYAKFSDKAGNWSIIYKDDIILDTILPQIQGIIPENNFITSQLQINITGAYTELNLDKILVNGVRAVVNGSNFMANGIQLSNEGDNRIEIKIIDLAQNQNTYQLNIIRDTIPPQNPVINPVTTPINILNQTISGIKTTDTELIVVECNSAVIDEIIYPTGTTWEANVTNMAEGENVISVTAYDKAGNRSNSVYTNITVDITPPAISITSPENGAVFRRRLIDIEGTVDDYEAEITANGIPAEIEAGIFKAKDVPLLEGDNNIIVRAVDKAGNISITQITVNYNITPLNLAWPMYRHDSRGTGQSEYRATTVGTLKWMIPYLRAGSLKIGQNNIFITSSRNSGAGSILKLDNLGNIFWENIADNSNFVSVLPDVYGGVYALRSDKYLCLLDENGEMYSENEVGIDKITETPIIRAEGDKIYFTTTNNSSCLYCLNSDGEEEWKYIFNLVSYLSPPVINNGNIYVLSGDGALYAIDVSGELIWKYVTGHSITTENAGAPAVGSNGVIYFGTDELYAVTPEGNLIWKFDTGSNIVRPISVSNVNSIKIICAVNQNKKIHSISEQGNLNWTYEISDDAFMRSNITIDTTGRIFFILKKFPILYYDEFRYNDQDRLISLKPDGTLEWEFEFDNAKYPETEVTIDQDGTIIFVNDTGCVYAIGYNNLPPVISGPYIGLCHKFSPNGDRENDTIEITAYINKAVDWVLSIKDRDDNVVKEFSGHTNNDVRQIWDGGNSIGEILQDGTYKIQITAVDSDGNRSVSEISEIEIDTVLPLNPSAEIAEGSETHSRLIDIELSADGASEVRISEDQQFSDTQWQAIESSIPYTLKELDGLKTLYIQFRDEAGNKTEPLVRHITLNQPLDEGGISISVVQGAYANIRNIILSLYAVGADEVIISENPQFQGAVWRGYSPRLNFTLSPSEGEKIIYIKFRDTFDNRESEVRNISVIYNSSNLTNTRVTIREGSIAYNSTVHLLLNADNAEKMIISENPDFTGAVWQAYKNETTFGLSRGNGQKTIYVKFKNNLCNETIPVSANINLDVPFLLISSEGNTGFQYFLEYRGYKCAFWNVTRFGFPRSAQMADYDLVLIDTDTEVSMDINSQELSEYLDNRGSLYLSSQYLLEMPNTSEFAEQYMGITDHKWSILNDNLQIFGVPNDPITNNKIFDLPYNTRYELSSVSILAINDRVSPILHNSEGGICAIRYPVDSAALDTYRIVYFAFNLRDIIWEAIDWLLRKLNVREIALGNGIEGSNTSLNSNIMIKFSTLLDQSTINNNTIQVTSSERGLLNGTLTFSQGSKNVEFDPVVSFNLTENITIKITTGVRNIYGYTLSNDYTYTFKPGIQIKQLKVDNITIRDTNNLTSLKADINIIFNSNLDAAAINNSTVQITSNERGVLTGVLSNNYGTIKFNPNQDFTPSETITVRVTTGVRSVFGSHLNEDYVYTFNLKELIQPLEVIQVYPSNNQEGVSTSSSIRIMFNQLLDQNTIQIPGAITIQGTLLGEIAKDVNYISENKTIILNPLIDFSPNEAIAITLTTTIKNIYGRSFKDNNYIFSFIVAEGADDIAPQINSLNINYIDAGNDFYDFDPWNIFYIPCDYYSGVLSNDIHPVISASLSEPCYWTISIYNSNGQIVRTINGFGTSISAQWDHKNNDGSYSYDGVYTYDITAQDLSGNETISPSGTIEIDTLAPSPFSFSDVKNAIQIVESGTIRNPIVHLNIIYEDDVASIKLLDGSSVYKDMKDRKYTFNFYSHAVSNIGWQTIASNMTFTFPNEQGDKTIMGFLRDRFGNIRLLFSMYSPRAFLDLLPQVVAFDVNTEIFSPNNDGITDQVIITATASEILKWQVSIKDERNQLVWNYSSSELENNINLTWDGYDNGGHLLSSGNYAYTINGIDGQGNSIEQITGQITLQLQAITGSTIRIVEAPITNTHNIILHLLSNGAEKMKLSEQADLGDSQWQDYAETAPFALSGADGLKTVYARFMDSAGIQTQPVSANITLDTTPPVVPSINPVTSPTDNPEQMISGTKSEDAIKINISGPVQVENLTYPTTTTWQAELNLQEGFNDIFINAEDSLGNTSQEVKTTIYYSWNIEKPVVEITTPQDNAVVKVGTIEGRVGDFTADVRVNNIPVSINTSGIFNTNLQLTEGENTITAVATDGQGDTGTDTIKIIYDTTAPQIRITNPPDNAIANITPVTVIGTVNDSNIEEVTVNLVPAIINEGNFTAEGIRLEQGQNTITVEAKDKAENTAQASITITLDNEAADYRIEEEYGSTTQMDPAEYPEAGTQHELKVKLYINDEPAQNETIQFQITEGNGQLNSPQIQTDNEGEASTIFTLDTNTEHINKVTAYPVLCPQEKVEFVVLGRAEPSAVINRLTDEALTYVPGAEIELIAKVTDRHNNPIKDEQINFAVLLGGGQLQQESATTNEMGEAYVGYIVGPTAGVVNTIRAELSNNPTVNTIFSIQTIALPEGITVDSIINRVNENDSRIQDIQADMIITSNMPWDDPEVRLHIWQKGEKQKTHETFPEDITLVRPQMTRTPNDTEFSQHIMSYSQTDNIYGLKSTYRKSDGNIISNREMFVDYNKGAVLKSQNKNYRNYGVSTVKTDYQEWVQIPEAENAWLYNRKIETSSYSYSPDIYTITTVISNRQINTGISDGEFE